MTLFVITHPWGKEKAWMLSLWWELRVAAMSVKEIVQIEKRACLEPPCDLMNVQGSGVGIEYVVIP